MFCLIWIKYFLRLKKKTITKLTSFEKQIKEKNANKNDYRIWHNIWTLNISLFFGFFNLLISMFCFFIFFHQNFCYFCASFSSVLSLHPFFLFIAVNSTNSQLLQHLFFFYIIFMKGYKSSSSEEESSIVYGTLSNVENDARLFDDHRLWNQLCQVQILSSL